MSFLLLNYNYTCAAMSQDPALNATDLERIRLRSKRLAIWWNIGLGATIAIMAAFVREVGIRAFGSYSIEELRRAEMHFFLRPYILIPWLIFAAYGFKETWTARSDWKYDHNLLWIFVVLIVSVCVLLFNLASMYFL